MNNFPLVGDLIEVPPVQTVIRLEEGQTRSEEISTSFVFTGEVTSHFTVLADALLKDHGRGFFLQGDFGSGKSHFLAILSAWLDGRPGAEVLAQPGVYIPSDRIYQGNQKVSGPAGRAICIRESLYPPYGRRSRRF